jgi:predicted ATPase/class 3 adenylate cyclase
VTFLFTDVVGSTRLWEAAREGMAKSLAVHDRIIEQAVADHGGYVFSTAGDSIAASFTTAFGAVSAAIGIQMALLREPWPGPEIRVRLGIHTGVADERGGKYFGPDVTRTARVMGLANAGQIVMTAVTAGLLAERLDVSSSLADRGHHRLKGFDRPEHVYELCHVDLPPVAEALHAGDGETLRLPIQLTSFVGRRAELAVVASLLDSSRLVTLTGACGSGKTRLAVEAAAAEGDRFPDGVWMVELAPLSEPTSVGHEAAALWGLRPGEGTDPIEVVKAHLRGRRLLLVVDNCEHLLAAASDLVSGVLSAGRGVSVLATSRESLGISGEAVYRVPSLTLAADDGPLDESDAVTLFLDRAQRVLPGFTPSALELKAIATVCRRLDGMPLGIELAAARLRALAPVELAARLQESYRILTAGAKTGLARQRTLHGAIDWSHDMLDDDAAALFRRLSVFAGGFDLAAAEAVAAGGVAEAWQVVHLVDQLVDKSLVVAAHGETGTRMRLLEPIRQYAQERLAATDEADRVRLAHARHYASLVARTAPRLRGPEQRSANDELLVEHDNIRSALGTLSDVGLVDELLQSCFHLAWFWAQSSLQVEGRRLLLAGLGEHAERASPPLLARAWWVTSLLAVFLTDPNGVDYADRGLQVARSTGDDTLTGWLCLVRGVAEATVGSWGPAMAPWFAAARKSLDGDGMAMWDAEWDPAVIRFLMAFDETASPDDRRRDSIEAITRAKALGDRFLAATAMLNIHRFIHDADDPWLTEMLDESVAIMGELDFRHGLGHALLYLGEAHRGRGDTQPAHVELAEAATILAEVGDLPCSTWSALQMIRGLIEHHRLQDAGRELAAVALRLLAFERELITEVASVACRLSLLAGDLRAAARFLGHARAFEPGAVADLAALDDPIAGGLAEAEFDRLLTEGAALGRRQMLEQIRAAVELSG